MDETHVDVFHDLKPRIKGEVLLPGDAGYAAGCAGFELSVEQHPAVVVMVESAQDVVAAVQFARQHQMGIGIQGTGHGTTLPANDSMLVNTARMKAVEVFPARTAARVEAGVKWKDVAPHVPLGLVPLSGTSTGVGGLGYTLGGGNGWFARRYGFAANSVLSADVVTADGQLLHASERKNPDLFWAIRGGGGNFGVVTALEFKLYPVKEFYGGGVFFPATSVREVFQAYSRWVETLPDTFTSRVVIYNLPPLPMVPEPLRGRWAVAVQGAYLGSETDGARQLAPIRQVAQPLVDTFAAMRYTQMDSIANDPQEPLATALHTDNINAITPEFVESLIGAVRIGEPSLLVLVELRHLEGAMATFPADGSAIGRPSGKFWLNTIGLLPSAEQAALATQQVARVEQAVRPYSTGRICMNGVGGSAAKTRAHAAFSPENYQRLVALKRRYDPQNTFRFNCNIDPQS